VGKRGQKEKGTSRREVKGKKGVLILILIIIIVIAKKASV
jgi:hypothetical protein